MASRLPRTSTVRDWTDDFENILVLRDAGIRQPMPRASLVRRPRRPARRKVRAALRRAAGTQRSTT
jgi:hypothetical protein